MSLSVALIGFQIFIAIVSVLMLPADTSECHSNPDVRKFQLLQSNILNIILKMAISYSS
jgi:hypothetical protein